MSSFIKKGLRQMKVAEDKRVKKHVKGFYKVIGQMDKVVQKLDHTLDYTEENINEYVKPISGRDLDSMEKFLVLGKLFHLKKELDESNNIK